MIRRASGLLIPPSVSSVKAPRYRCHICGADFHEDEASAWTRHVVKCAKRHEMEIREASPRYQAPGFYDPEEWDVEYEQHVRRTGKFG